MNEQDKLPTIRFDPAYSGGLLHMDPKAWPFPTVFDIEGLEEHPQEVPIVRDHNQDKKVGQTTRITYDGGKIEAEGVVLNYGIDPDADKVVELARRGAKLQASVATNYIKNENVEFIEEGQKVTVNNQTFTGPVEIVRRWRLKEISIVTIGADDEGTAVTIAQAARGNGDHFKAPRQQGEKMSKWERFFKGLGMSPSNSRRFADRMGKASDCPEEQTAEEVLKVLEEEQAAKAKRGKANDGKTAEDEEKAALCDFAADIGAVDPEEMTEDELKVLEAAFAKFGKANDGKTTSTKEEEQGTEAKAAGGFGGYPRSGVAAWTKTRYPADLLGRGSWNAYTGTKRPTPARVAEASLFVSNGVDDETLKRLGYNDAEIDEAQKKENRTLSLRGLIYRTGEAKAGYTDEAKIADVLRKAQYMAQRAEYDPGYRTGRAAGHLSTVDIPNVLANVINKSMLNGVMMVDDPTDSISRVVAAKDFRPQYFINLLTSGEFADVKPNGEVENLKLSDTAYENSARMRGMEVKIGYETIANDDMNAIQEVPKIMGRKAGLRKQKIFFDAFTKASAATGAAALPIVKGNPQLNLAGLDKACAAFRALKDDDNDPIGARPRFLIVPPALEANALNLVMASEIVAGATGDNTQLAVVPNVKRYASRFEVVTSEYLGADSAFASSWSDNKYMLLADPQDVPLMILSYYQNQKAPTIKTVYGDTELDGLKYVLWWGLGVSVAEKRSCVVSNPSN